MSQLWGIHRTVKIHLKYALPEQLTIASGFFKTWDRKGHKFIGEPADKLMPPRH